MINFLHDHFPHIAADSQLSTTDAWSIMASNERLQLGKTNNDGRGVWKFFAEDVYKE